MRRRNIVIKQDGTEQCQGKKIPLVNQSWLLHFSTEANNPLLPGEQLWKACAIQYFECSWLKIKYRDHSTFPSLWEQGLCLAGFLWCHVEGHISCSVSSQHHTLTAHLSPGCKACARGKERDGKTCGGKKFHSRFPWLADGKFKTNRASQSSPKIDLS